MAIAWEAARLRDPLIFDRVVQHCAGVELSDQTDRRAVAEMTDLSGYLASVDR